MNKKHVLSAFNDQFTQFMDDVQNVFPEDVEILTAKNIISTVRSANPTILIRFWKTYIVEKYREPIEQGDLSFFVEKDYAADVGDVHGSRKIMDTIGRLRGPIQQMGEQNQQKVMQYIQNLTSLAILYGQFE